MVQHDEHRASRPAMTTPATEVQEEASKAPDRWLFVALLVLIAWLPLPWGSKPVAATAFFGMCAALLMTWRLVLLVRGFGLPQFTPAARLVLHLWLGWIAWCAAYLVPLPAGLLGSLSPSARDLHGAVAALPDGTALNTLSILPGATVDRVILAASYLALFWVVLVTVARNRLRQRWVLVTLMAAGLAQALYGSVMTLSGWEWGFFEPKSVGRGWATGTFVNRNHFAGYLELTLAASIALVLADLRERRAYNWKQVLANLIELALSPRMRTRIMIAVMVIALVLTRSRMGNIAFFVSLAVCANLYIFIRNPKFLVKSLLFFASLFVVDLLIVSEQYGLEKVVQRIEQTDFQAEQRALAFRDLVPALEQYGTVGAGPGTFAAAFSPHRGADLKGYYDHAHNDYAEAVIETGIVGALLLGAIAALVFAHAVLLIWRRRDPMASALGFAAAMALMALGLHSLVDFNLRIPAVAATLVTIMALALSCSTRSSQAPPREATAPA